MVCQARAAVLHITDIINGAPHEMHICEQCAQQKGFQDVLSNISVHQNPATAHRKKKQEAEEEARRCPNCGITLKAVKEKMRFGCVNDIDYFKDFVEGLLERIHGGVLQHVGRLPKTATEVVKKENMLLRLQREMDLAIKSEEFEKAAKLKKDIEALKGTTRKSTDKGA